MKKPLCFESLEQYITYESLMKYRPKEKGFNYCVDCTPMFQKKMFKEHKCSHPETKFLWIKKQDKKERELVGRRYKRSRVNDSARNSSQDNNQNIEHFDGNLEIFDGI